MYNIVGFKLGNNIRDYKHIHCDHKARLYFDQVLMMSILVLA
jgi:hypothetical protein